MIRSDRSLIVPKQRLDRYLAAAYPEISRAFLQKLCTNGQVLVNGKPEKSGFMLKPADKVEVAYDLAGIGKVESIELPVLYEDDNVLVIDKPSGVISHARGKFWNEPSVASFVRQRTDQQGERAGIVHRLDRATSGVMICAKTEQAMKVLQKQFADRTVTKTYAAVIKGSIRPEQAMIDMPIERNPKKPATFRVGPNGKPAQTIYKLIQTVNNYELLELEPKTGRTHQLRVHLAYRGNPIVGDMLYGGEPAPRLLLHAQKLRLTLPNGKTALFEASLPDIFQDYLAQ